LFVFWEHRFCCREVETTKDFSRRRVSEAPLSKQRQAFQKSETETPLVYDEDSSVNPQESELTSSNEVLLSTLDALPDPKRLRTGCEVLAGARGRALSGGTYRATDPRCALIPTSL
jgi:hypothetical protein